MVEAGAGYGRWLVSAACALRALGRSTRTHLIAIEAEPTHFKMISEHFRHNGVDPQAHTLIEAAVAARDGETHFIVGSPREWYGQAIVPEGFRMEAYPDSCVVKLPTVSLRTVLRDLGTVDLLDTDIQGAEADAIPAAIDVLTQKVKRAVIATHSRDIHRRVRRAFRQAGWRCLADHGWGFTKSERTIFGPITFGDGVQHWVNPTLE
jgi:FkbM family methyltransferase